MQVTILFFVKEAGAFIRAGSFILINAACDLFPKLVWTVDRATGYQSGIIICQMTCFVRQDLLFKMSG